jgi:hypothetical protein
MIDRDSLSSVLYWSACALALGWLCFVFLATYADSQRDWSSALAVGLIGAAVIWIVGGAVKYVLAQSDRHDPGTGSSQDGLSERAYAPISPAKSGSNVKEPIMIDSPTAIERWTLKAIEFVVYIMISILLAAIGFVLLAHLMGHKLTA